MDQLDRPRDYHTKLDKDEYHMISLICGITNKNLLTKKKQTHRSRKQTWLLEGKGVGVRINQKFGISSYKLLYIK